MGKSPYLMFMPEKEQNETSFLKLLLEWHFWLNRINLREFGWRPLATLYLEWDGSSIFRNACFVFGLTWH